MLSALLASIHRQGFFFSCFMCGLLLQFIFIFISGLNIIFLRVSQNYDSLIMLSA